MCGHRIGCHSGQRWPYRHQPHSSSPQMQIRVAGLNSYPSQYSLDPLDHAPRTTGAPRLPWHESLSFQRKAFSWGALIDELFECGLKFGGTRCREKPRLRGLASISRSEFSCLWQHVTTSTLEGWVL